MRKLIVMIVCCLIYGCTSVPKAPELNFPENAHAVVCNMDQQVRNSLNEDQSTELIKMLEGMIPTNKQSIHDRPVQKLDYYIELSHEREEVLYFYSENGKYYAELPYTGIYECHEDFYKSLNEISSVEEIKKAVRINEKLYLCTDEIISEIRCGVMDGVISSAIESYRYPIENDQSNFGTGYEYQYSEVGMVDVVIDGEWIRFKEEGVYSCVAEIIEMKDAILLYPYIEDIETAEVRNIPEIDINHKMFEDYKIGDTVRLTFRQLQKKGSIEILQVLPDDTLYQRAYRITDFIEFNPVKIEIVALPNTEYSQTVVIENQKEINELMHKLDSIVIYDQFIEPRGAGKISYEMKFFDQKGNEILICDYSQIIVNEIKYFYRWTKTDNTLSALLKQYFDLK